jgi:hypothetical protein
LKNREVDVKYYTNFKDSVSLLETNSKIINDSLSKLPEFGILRFSIKKYDELNFIIPTDTAQLLRYFKISHDTLTCDVYFNSRDGCYYFGKIVQDDNENIILILGDYKYYGNVNDIPVSTKFQFRILMPGKFRLNKLFLRWIDNH